MHKTLEEYINQYEKKTKETFKPKEGFHLFFLPERGFCEIAVASDKSIVQIYQLCGDGKFWRDYAVLLARSLGIKKLGTICIKHNIPAYMRLFGYKVTNKEPLSDGSFIYYGEDKEGKKVRLSPVRIHDDKNRISYLVTWEV